MILEKMSIENSVWSISENGKFIQVIFPLESSSLYEGTLTILNEYGIGQRLNSVVSVIPCSLYYQECEESSNDKIEEKKKLELYVS